MGVRPLVPEWGAGGVLPPTHSSLLPPSGSLPSPLPPLLPPVPFPPLPPAQLLLQVPSPALLTKPELTLASRMGSGGTPEVWTLLWLGA